MKPTTEIQSDLNKGRNSRKGKILIIDDSLENIKVLATILREEEYDILTAHEPLKGISIAQSKLPDIILLDIMMKELDGYEVCKALKKNDLTKEIPVLFLTGLTDSNSTLKGFELGAVDFITKPFNKLELLARVKSHLNIKFSQERIKALFESEFHTYITVDHDFHIVNYNHIANVREELFRKRKFVIGESIFSFINPEDHTVFKRKMEAVFSGKISKIEREYISNGISSWFTYYFEPIIGNKSEIIGCLINGTDTTEKKALEVRLQQYNHKLKEIHIETKESLEYASYIQNAIFPSKREFSEAFKEHFLIYKPKDIVSGDFYWMHTEGDRVLIAIGDCVGHGVAGALLTTVSILLLQRIVKYNKITDPDEILLEMDSDLKDTLREREDGIEHGLEISICVFDKKNKMLEFAGAKRSLIVVKNEELVEIKGSRFDLGGTREKLFESHMIPLEDGMLFYLYSDGVVDQIGGSASRRFRKDKLQNLIKANKHESLQDQQGIYEHAIKEWQREESQTDDITFLGLRVS